MRKLKAFLFLLIFFSACAPKVEIKKDLPPLPESFVNSQANSTLPQLPERWWEIFGIEELNRLVEKVLSANHDLIKARFRIEELSARLKKARAERFPEVNLDFSGTRSRTSFSRGIGPPQGFIYGEFQGAVLASYEVDLWRRLSSAEKAAYFEVLSAEESRLALAQSLAAEAVSRYLEAAFYNCELKILSEEVRISEKRLSLLQKRFEAGLFPAARLLEEEKKLSALKALLPETRRALREALQELELLSGSYPAGTFQIRETSSVCKSEISPPPPGLPSELLKRRPDIRAAEAKLRAAAEMVKVARAARFPHLMLTVEEGRVSNALSDLLSHQNRLWTLSFDLTQPLFNAGKLKAEEVASRKILRQAEEEYVQTVLEAFREVEFGLLSEEKLRKVLLETQKELMAASLSLSFYENRFKKGLISLPDYLDFKIQTLEAQRKVLRARRSLILNRIFLFRALGGGFNLPGKETS